MRISIDGRFLNYAKKACKRWKLFGRYSDLDALKSLIWNLALYGLTELALTMSVGIVVILNPIVKAFITHSK